MQIPILNGIYTDENSDYRTSYPRNMIPVPKSQGISAGYLRPADGIVSNGTGPGVGRGGRNWSDVCYRVMGAKLVSIDAAGTVTTIGDVGGSGQVSMDNSFTHLAVATSGSLYLYDGTTLQQNTDTDLGVVVDVIWIDGYFMTTDGENLIVTELNNPFSVNPLKYGSSEVDPDPVKALIEINNEVHAINRYTIEAFDNIGGSGFPFQRIDGAQISRGTIGTHACCAFLDNIAFLGSGRNESIAVYLGGSGKSVKISTREIDQIIETYTEEELAAVVFESRIDKGHQHLYVRFPDVTWVYDNAASAVVGEPVWFSLDSGISDDFSEYRAKNLVYCYGKWLIEDPQSSANGYLTNTVASHWGEDVSCEFGTQILYNEGRGAIIHELELVGLSGRAVIDEDPTIWTSYSTDGETWSTEKPIKAGKQGQRNKRLVWLQQGTIDHWRIQRFRCLSDSMLSVSRLEARLEPLAW